MQWLRKILFPFSLLYGWITRLRNWGYDQGWLSSTAYTFPVICVGNLSVGGTGKSPMIEYLIRLLHHQYALATLSRGYKRTTTGFYALTGNEQAAETGDEPLQFKRKFPQVQVAVDENRREGIAALRQLTPKPEVILLDDAYQHRKVEPGFSILLTAYHDLYSNDFMLPAGNLREPRSGAKRAQVIVVTKCPADLSDGLKQKIRESLNLQPHQSLFFTSIAYADYVFNAYEKRLLSSLPTLTLVTGIANPRPLVNYLTEKNIQHRHLKFPDHHRFNEQEIARLKQHDFILTTEKDYVRLKDRLPAEKLFYLPIETHFLDNEEVFNQGILKFIAEY